MRERGREQLPKVHWMGEVPDDAVDVAVAFHVIEHLEDPLRQLRPLAERLQPGGFVYAVTPNLDCWEHRLLGPWWNGFASYHLSQFTRRTLPMLLNELGFKTRDVTTNDDGSAAFIDLSLGALQWLSRRPISAELHPHEYGDPARRVARINRALAISSYRLWSVVGRPVGRAGLGNELHVIARKPR